jgi:hypothetical protein
MAAAFIAPTLVAMAVPMFIDTVISLAKNENQNTKGNGSMFTYASVIPSVEFKKNIRQMDTNLKIVLAMTVEKLKQMVGESKVPEWNDIVSTMKQNILFEKCENSSRYGIRTFERDSLNFFKVCGGPDESTIKDIKEWFVDVLEAVDPELKQLTGILKDNTFENLANIVASTGSSVNSISTMIRRSDYEEFTLADIGLIRYPSYQNPKAKIFRLKIKSWRRCRRVLAFESNRNGLTVEIDSQEYIPREEVISHMRDRILTEDDVTYLCDKAESILLKM